MSRSLRDVFRARPWQKILTTVLTFAGLILIVWAAVTDRRNPCSIDETGTAEICQSLVEFLIPFLIALGFWTIGVVVWLNSRQTLVLAFFIVIADILAMGMLAATGAASDDSARLFHMLLAWAAPLAFHYCHSLLERAAGQIGRAVLALLYGLAVVLSTAFVLFPADAMDNGGWFGVLRTGARLSVMSAWALGWFLLFRDYQQRASGQVRRRIRLVTFGTLFAFAPLVFLSLLPDTMGMPYRLPYELTLPWLVLSPLAYLYSLLRLQLINSEPVLDRAGVYYLLTLVFLSAYLMSASLLSRWPAISVSEWPLINGFLSVGLLFLFAAVKRAFEKLMNWILYGVELTYMSVIGHLVDTLTITLDRERLRHLLVHELGSTLRLTKVALFLKEDDNEITWVDDRHFELAPEAKRIPTDGKLACLLQAASEPLRDAKIHRALARVSLAREEQALLSLSGVAYWLPLKSGDGLQGFFLIGVREDNVPFSAEYVRILATLSRQAGLTAHNVSLMEQVRTGQRELNRAHQESLAGYERERKQLARELHDGAVQQLLGISYQVLEHEKGLSKENCPEVMSVEKPQLQTLETIRGSILGVVIQLRGLISNLRPTGLEELGLGPALEEYVTRLEGEGGSAVPDIELNLEEHATNLPEAISICLYRSAQEALRNAIKHAAAQRIHVILRVQDTEVELVVEDDGCGFFVPARLSGLARRNHFGLIGISERVAWVGGEFRIISHPGSGTAVRIKIPLAKAECKHGENNSSSAS